MDVDINLVDLSFLISRWSSYSQTFVAVWGEFCLSLEVVFMLTGFQHSGITMKSTLTTTRGRGCSRACIHHDEGQVCLEQGNIPFVADILH